MVIRTGSGQGWWLLAKVLGLSLLLLAGWAGAARAGVGVSCVSSRDCWSVGGRQTLHWDGTTWSAVPAGTQQPDGLAAVACASRSDCWAVGSFEEAPPGSSATELNEVVHWNGQSWSSVSIPDPAGTAPRDFNSLRGVRCISASDCWAVGSYRTSGGPGLIEAFHWNGSAWSMVPTPEPGGTTGQTSNYDLDPSNNALNAISCASSSNCWAVGTFRLPRYFTGENNGLAPPSYSLALHWNGTKWSRRDTPQPPGNKPGHTNSLNAVWCVTRSDCWADGAHGFIDNDYEGPDTSRNEILHWDGAKWSAVAAPQPAGKTPNSWNVLNGLTCTSAKRCWAVGNYVRVDGINLVLRWNGTSWKRVPAPNPPGYFNELWGVSCTSRSSCWATGDSQARHAVTDVELHWDGTKWSRQTSNPNP